MYMRVGVIYVCLKMCYTQKKWQEKAIGQPPASALPPFPEGSASAAQPCGFHKCLVATMAISSESCR